MNESLKDFQLEKVDLNVVKGGVTAIRVVSTTGVLIYDIDNQVYYNIIGQVVTTTEAAVN
ncbi:MAG: hypothetical protein AB7E36_14735 [Salinivirgaceae bacterium]